MVKPLIGITGRRLRSSMLTDMDARFAQTDFDFFFADYARCVAKAGGVPVHLPFEAGSLDCVDHLQGIVVTGGQDVHPGRWGGPPLTPEQLIDPRLDRTAPDEERDEYEAALIVAALRRGLGVLGICRGHQILNVVLGGTLVPDLSRDEIVHFSAAAAPSGEAHDVSFADGSIASGIYGSTARVSSWHHQAVAECAPSLRAVGWAADGVIEAIEMPGHPVLGVQWHPEWHPTPDPIFDWLTRTATVSA